MSGPERVSRPWTISVARRSKGARILGTGTTANDSPVQLEERVRHQEYRIAGSKGSLDVLDAVCPKVAWGDSAAFASSPRA